MKAKHLFVIIPSGIVLLIFIRLFFPDQNADQKNLTRLADSLQNFRKDKQFYFKNNIQSPVFGQKNPVPLSFFAFNAQAILTAKVELLENQQGFDMPLTRGSSDKYIQKALLILEFNGKKDSLIAFQKTSDLSGNELFIPFKDASNGKETYAGGRFLDVVYPGGNSLVLDFNYAYHPFCIFNENYSCPIVPTFNTLHFAIAAGERLEK